MSGPGEEVPLDIHRFTEYFAMQFMARESADLTERRLKVDPFMPFEVPVRAGSGERLVAGADCSAECAASSEDPRPSI
jgi:hypothetical protein